MSGGIAQDHTGQIFGRLRVLCRDYSIRATTWRCVCDPDHGGCGKETSVNAYLLRRGNTRSCGCLQKELQHSDIVHGHSRKKRRSREYATWSNMLSRCYNQNTTEYHRYGGRGIYVCDRWRHDFTAFLADMGERPSSKHSIDRYPDNDGPYSPDNRRWATRTEQMRNTSVNRVVVRQGEAKCVTEAAAEVGLSTSTITARLKRGMDDETALSLPPDKTRWHRKHTFNGQSLTLAEWDAVTGISRRTLNTRLCTGWELEHALTLPVVKGKRARRWGHGRWADLPPPSDAADLLRTAIEAVVSGAERKMMPAGESTSAPKRKGGA